MQVEVPVAIYQAVHNCIPKSRPPFRARPFDVQLIGGMVLYEGKIAEMATGEGKTIVGTAGRAYLAVPGGHALPRRHGQRLPGAARRRVVRPAFEPAGHDRRASSSPDMDQRAAAGRPTSATSTYGTNSEFGFDYLRDNMKLSVAEQVQGPLDFAIVDEVDSS